MIKENYMNRKPYPLAKDVDMPTVSRLAVGGSAAQQDAILRDKAKFVVSGVPIAAGKPSMWSRLKSLADVKSMSTFNSTLNQTFADRKSGSTWSEPPSAYAARAPYNNAQVTDSGHAFELDDTPGAERVHLFHRSGSFIEMHPNGTVVYKNMKDGYLITMSNQFIKVSGNCHIAVDGKTTIHSKGDVNVQSDGDINFNTKKDFNVHAKNINLRAKQKAKLDGLKIDLRYVKLPTPFAIVNMGVAGPPQMVPMLNMAAMAMDFPSTDFSGMLNEIQRMDPATQARTVSSATALTPAQTVAPAESPLSNPAVYSKQTFPATNYRAFLFDAPEEVENFEQYTAHIGNQTALGDLGDGDPRELPGNAQNIDETPATNAVAPDYLDFADYKGTFIYTEDYPLGNTSFVLRDLVDLALYPDIVAPLQPEAKPTIYEPVVTDPADLGKPPVGPIFEDNERGVLPA
jgi:hypothetical protein